MFLTQIGGEAVTFERTNKGTIMRAHGVSGQEYVVKELIGQDLPIDTYHAINKGVNAVGTEEEKQLLSHCK